MWSIRMRAARQAGGERTIHVSGAEGLYRRNEIDGIARDYLLRAMSHPRGEPDQVVITVDRVESPPPDEITSLPVVTLRNRTTDRAGICMRELLKYLGVSHRAIAQASAVLHGRHVMRGASLVMMGSGVRVEPEKERGVRVSRFGITRAARVRLGRSLGRLGIGNQTVMEALILASKVISCSDVAAEVCVSDDPDYTTGYVASRQFGYVRIPHVKKKGDRRGGRVFFLRDDADIGRVIEFLEQRPVLITATAACAGERSVSDVLRHHHQ